MSSDQEEEEFNSYAGGEKSGIAVQNPKKGSTSSSGVAHDIVKNILKQAANGSGTSSHESTANPVSTAFTGRGTRLGDTTGTAGTTDETTGSEPTHDAPESTVTRTLTFWADGFSVEDGPLLRYDDPQNQVLLEQIKNGRAPLSLLNVQPDQPVEVKVAHKLQEQYTPPPKKPTPAFSGSGQRLGGITSTSVPLNTQQSTSQPPAASQEKPKPTMQIDPNEPVTNIQIRLGDGTRLVARFNHSHTTADLYNFISSARSEARAWRVVTMDMPPRNVEKGEMMLKEAGLINAVVVQRYT